MNQLQNNQKFLLVAMSAFSLLWLIARITITGKMHYFFLNWNLFLAFLPLLFTQLLSWNSALVRKRWVRGGIVLSWLLFFPNAPYILTDLFHLANSSSVPKWFDFILILSYAWAGLLAGFISLRRIELTIFANVQPRLLVFYSSALIFLSAFGIYLGRFLRFNSWDVIQRPSVLLGEITERFTRPLEHPTTWGMTIGMGVLLTIMYWSLRMFSDPEPQEKVKRISQGLLVNKR